MMSQVLTVINVVNSVVLSLIFVRCIFCKVKITTKNFLFSCCVCVLLSIITLVADDKIYIKLPLNYIVLTLFYYLVFKFPLKRSLIINALYFGMIASLELVGLIVLQQFTNLVEYSNIVNSNGSFLAELICQLVFLIFAIIIGAFRNQNDDSQSSVKGWIVFLFFPVLTVVVAFMMIYGVSVEMLNTLFNRLIILSIAMFILNVLLFFLLDNMIEREREMHDKQLLIEQAEHVNKMYQSLSNEREKQKAQVHDNLNHLNVILNLAEEGSREKEIEYIKELIGRESNIIDIIDTGNPIINAVLNIKYREAQERNVVFPIVADYLADLPIKDSDLVIILSNIIDNAFEAVNSLENRKVVLKIVRYEDSLLIDSSNPYVGDVNLEKKHFTTKRDKNNHGFGLENIRHAVEENNGEFYIDNSNDEFHIAILLPL